MTPKTIEDNEQPSRLATVREAARYLNVSRSLLYNLMDAGRLGYVKIGRCRRVPWEGLERLIADNKVGI